MSEPCVFCGGYSPSHSETCPKYTPTPVYDLAEFERQLEAQQACAKVRGEFYMEALLKNVCDALKASKREAK